MKKKSNFLKYFSAFAQYFILYCVILSPNATNAQQTTQYSLWQLNRFGVMPAYAGLDNNLNTTLAYRRQWLGLNGSPQSIGINIHTPLDALHGGVGLRVESDQLGAERNLGVMASYAYHIKIDDDNRLSLGGGVGILQKTFDGAILKPANPDQPDTYIPANSLQATTPNFQAGLYYKNKNFHFGASFVQYSPTRLRYSTTAVTNIRLQPTFSILASNKFQIGDDFAIEPAVLFKSDPTQMQAEISTFFHFREAFFVGAAFRGLSYDVPDAATASFGFRINPSFSLAYAYDIGLSPLRTSHSGTHEILLIYKYNKRIGAALMPKMMYNTRHY